MRRVAWFDPRLAGPELVAACLRLLGPGSVAVTDDPDFPELVAGGGCLGPRRGTLGA